MAQKKLVILITRGLDDERSSVAWSIANAGIASGLEVMVFLAASGVDWVRRGAAAVARLNPLDPTMKEMIENLLATGGRILVCPPCAKVRGYAEQDIIDGVTIAGAPGVLEMIKQDAAALCF
jgi:predicted peroxiredoxin